MVKDGNIQLNEQGHLAAGIYPLWFWNKPMDNDSIDAQVKALSEQGYHGAVISARQGYRDAYANTSWCERVAYAVEACRRHEVKALVADEFPYPSGQAGGLVTMGQPQRWATRLEQTEFCIDVVDSAEQIRKVLQQGLLLSCFAWPINDNDEVQWSEKVNLFKYCGVTQIQDTYREVEQDLSAYNGRRYFSYDPHVMLECQLPKGKWLLIASQQKVELSHKYTEQAADTLDREAMAAFIQSTHKRYEEHFSLPLGQYIAGIFVDEIAAAQWSRHLPRLWQERHHSDLCELLPALIREDFPNAKIIREQLAALRRDRFIEVFLKPVREWCHQQGVVLMEERPLIRLADAAEVDIPGNDAGHVRAGTEKHDLVRGDLRRNALATASAAHWYNKAGGLSEVGHSLAWGATLEDMRLLYDNLLLLGIRYIVPHALFASTAGLRKHDAPPSYFWQQTWWAWHHKLSEHVTALLKRWEQTQPVVTTLVIDPSAFGITDEHAQSWEEIHQCCLSLQYDLLIADTDILRAGKLRNGAWHYRGHQVTQIILPPCQNLNEEMEGFLNQCYANDIACIDCRKPGALSKLPALENMWATQGQEADKLHRSCRSFANGSIDWFWVNNSSEKVKLFIPEEKRRFIQHIPTTDECVMKEADYVEFSPYQSVLLHESDHKSEHERDEIIVLDIEWPDEWDATCKENTIRLGTWNLEINDISKNKVVSFMTSEFPLQQALKNYSGALPVNIKVGFGIPVELECPLLQCRYQCQVKRKCAGSLDLLIERDAIMGQDWQIYINKQKVFEKSDLKPSHYASNDPFDAARISIDEYLLQNVTNEIELIVITDQLVEGMTNPLYVAGHFSCGKTEGVVYNINEAYVRAPITDLQKLGVAYTRESITWHSRLSNIQSLPEMGSVLVYLPEICQTDAFAIQFENTNGKSEVIPVLWNPRCVRVPVCYLQGDAIAVRIIQYPALAGHFHAEYWNAQEHRVISCK